MAGVRRQQPRIADMQPCPCGTGKPYAACCGALHRGAKAPTAEALMRSRYTAFVGGLADYLHSTWAKATRPALSKLPSEGLAFNRLQIVRTQGGSLFDSEGVVEFAAYSPAGVQREVSRFVREDGAWVYLDGDVQ
ncbi:hypothetical protein CGOTT_05760 [Corynebacterium gottingense]|nr:hypothetical protein CGOTT_05760 [Corynebacterium gottingense]WJZ15406.1 hypothetical protein CGOTTB_05770 [Corynebacterium gottingense]WKC60087.1 hypothetical protein CHAD_06060 [Corynebacterium hadale]